MKKLLSLILALLMLCMVLAACDSGKKDDADRGSDDETTVSTTLATTTIPTTAPTTAPTTVPALTDEQIVANFVEKEGPAFAEGVKEGFEGSGLTCRVAVQAVGTGMVADIICNEFVDVTDDVKAQMQEAFDQQQEGYESALAILQTGAPQLTYLVINFCAADGEVVATIRAGK